MAEATAAHGLSSLSSSSAAVEMTTAAEMVSLVAMMAAASAVATALASSSSYFFFAAAAETATTTQAAVAAANSFSADRGISPIPLFSCLFNYAICFLYLFPVFQNLCRHQPVNPSNQHMIDNEIQHKDADVYRHINCEREG